MANTMTGQQRREKPPAVVSAREAMLETLGFGELRRIASERLGQALNAETITGHAAWNHRLRAISLVMSTLPKEQHGNAKDRHAPLVVLVQPWIGELSAKTAKRLQAASVSAEVSSQPAYTDMSASLEPKRRASRQGPPLGHPAPPEMSPPAARLDPSPPCPDF